MRIKNILIITLTLLSSVAFSKTTPPQTPSQKTPTAPKPKTYQTKKSSQSFHSDSCLYPAYSAPARIDVQAAWNFIVSASFIYWQPEMVGIDLGYIQSNDLSTQAHSVVNFDSDYYPGFKVLLGTHYDYDNWNINARYTRYHAKEKDKNSKGDIIFHVFSDTVSITPLRSIWNPQIDYFDLEVGRPYYSGKHLVIKPYASVKGGWSKQKFRLNAILSDLDQEASFRTKSWFLGPRGTLDINWLLTHDFRIFLNSSVSLMYQKFKTQDRFISRFYNPLTFTTKFDAKSIQLTPAIDLNPGFGWSTYFDHNNWHVDLYAAYNFVYFFNQNEFLSVDTRGDFMLHGFELSLKLNF